MWIKLSPPKSAAKIYWEKGPKHDSCRFEFKDKTLETYTDEEIEKMLGTKELFAKRAKTMLEFLHYLQTVLRNNGHYLTVISDQYDVLAKSSTLNYIVLLQVVVKAMWLVCRLEHYTANKKTRSMDPKHKTKIHQVILGKGVAYMRSWMYLSKTAVKRQRLSLDAFNDYLAAKGMPRIDIVNIDNYRGAGSKLNGIKLDVIKMDRSVVLEMYDKLETLIKWFESDMESGMSKSCNVVMVDDDDDDYTADDDDDDDDDEAPPPPPRKVMTSSSSSSTTTKKRQRIYSSISNCSSKSGGSKSSNSNRNSSSNIKKKSYVISSSSSESSSEDDDHQGGYSTDEDEPPSKKRRRIISSSGNRRPIEGIGNEIANPIDYI